jgi:site-specific recombinase XerD
MTDEIINKTTQQGLAPTDLIEKARGYMRASKSEGTLRTYASVWRIFTQWCASRGVDPLPATPDTVIAYVVEQAEVLRPQTITKHLAAISQAHKLSGHETPTQAEPVRLVMKGLRRAKGVGANPKKALRVEHMKKMVAVLPDTLLGDRDKAILLVGYVTGMRRSEIVALDVDDVTFEPEGAVVTIRRGKRDQEGHGRRVPVLRGRHEDTCPVRALQQWLLLRGEESGPLFVRLDPGAQGERLGDRSVALMIKRMAERAGLDPVMFSGHSLRRGFATETARAGASDRQIARTTGHKSMKVLGGYIEEGTIFEAAAASLLDL